MRKLYYNSLLLFLFITFTLPKAGTKVGEFPLYVSLIVALFLLPLLLMKSFKSRAKEEFYFKVYIFLIALSVIVNTFYSFLFSTASGCSLDSFPLVMSMIFPAFFFLPKYLKIHDSSVEKVLFLSFVIITLYGIAQKLLGDYTVVIPGITANYADAVQPQFLELKYNAIWALNYIKLSSTYQNGNLFGVNYILISWFAFFYLQKKNKTFTLYIAIAVYICVCLLTASVTVYIGLTVSLLLYTILFLNQKLTIERILYISITLLFFSGLFYLLFTSDLVRDLLQVRLLERNILAGGGRPEHFVDYIHWVADTDNAKAFLFGSLCDLRTGGAYEMLLPAIFVNFGVTVCIVSLVLTSHILKTIGLRDMRGIGLLAYFIAAISDGAFWLPPTPINLFILLGFAYYSKKQNNSIKHDE